jgi:hypothetical protein
VISSVALTLLIPSFDFAEDAKQLPDPGRKLAEMVKPVQVYILLGRSNTLGVGKINPRDEDADVLDHLEFISHLHAISPRVMS